MAAPFSVSKESKKIHCHCEPVTDVTGVALSKDSLRSQSPGSSENYRQSEKAPLADQGWCSAQRLRMLMIASGNHTIIHAVMAVSRKAMTEGIRTSTFGGTLNKARLYNPSVSRLRETREPAPFTQGSRWVLPHQCVYRCFSEKPENCTTFSGFSQ